MADQTQTPKLTPTDPVDEETMKKLSELHEARLKIADRVLDLEAEKIRLMVAVRQVDMEKNRIFEKVLVDRGLPPGFPINIEGSSGKIQLLAAVPEGQPAGEMLAETPAP
jgi:hypothetical protein